MVVNGSDTLGDALDAKDHPAGMSPDDGPPRWDEPTAEYDQRSPNSLPQPIGPWSTLGPGVGRDGTTDIAPATDPHADRDAPKRIFLAVEAIRRRGRWTIVLAIVYVVLQGIRLGLSTGHDPIAVTIGWDAGLIAVVGALVALGASRARRQPGVAPTAPIGPVPAVAWVTGLVALSVVASFVGRNLVFSYRRGIPGASGYTTFDGPHGMPMAKGRPWGPPCQPVLFDVSSGVPDGDYQQIVSAVGSARADGVDVAIETRNFMWDPNQLYPAGQNLATVKVVAILGDWKSRPRLANGQLERIEFGWNAAVSSDHRHEHLTDLQATLWLSQLDGHPDRVRIATRQLIAFAQGVGGSTAAGSGISRGTTVDEFSPDDLHAMALMSGCDFQTAPSPLA